MGTRGKVVLGACLMAALYLLALVLPVAVRGAGVVMSSEWKQLNSCYTNLTPGVSRLGRIDIDWTLGDIRIVRAEGNYLNVYEEARPGIFGICGTTVDIDVSDESHDVSVGQSANFGSKPFYERYTLSTAERRLVIEIPESFELKPKSVSINGTSASCRLEGVATESLDVSLQSGSLHATGLDVNAANIRINSGVAGLDGRIEDALEANLGSGALRVACEEVAPQRTDLSFSSGAAELVLPKDASFAAEIRRGSGTFSSDFDLERVERLSDRELYLHEGHGALIRADYSSGELSIVSGEA